jgi:hypothetical protein
MSLVAVLALAGTALAGNGAGAGKSSSSISLVLLNTAAPNDDHLGNCRAALRRQRHVQRLDDRDLVPVRQYQVLPGWRPGRPGIRLLRLQQPGLRPLLPAVDGAEQPICTASLEMYSNGHWKQLASTSFHVNA